MASTSSPAAAAATAAAFIASSLSSPLTSSFPNPKPNRLRLRGLPGPLSLRHSTRLATFSAPSASGDGRHRGNSRNEPPKDRSPRGSKPKISDEWGEKSEPVAEPPSASGDGRNRGISRNEPPKDRSPGGGKPKISDEWGEKSEPEAEPPYAADPPRDEDEWGKDAGAAKAISVTDEWGEKAEPEVEAPAQPDPPKDDDEWGGGSGGVDGYLSANGSASVSDKLEDLKRCLVDTLYGTDFGLRASAEDRAEILELVSQLESQNPTAAPLESPELLDGNWILLYTAFSELLPLLAIGGTPFLKVKKISQAIDTNSMTIVNATTLSSPFASLSFSASASFEVRSPSRIQVKFTEGSFQPPEISSTVDLPENVDVFGQKINLRPVQQTLNPIQQAVANVSRTISGQPPLKVPLTANRGESWLLTTYLDKDFRISRGDGGLFVLAKEGSPLLDLLS